jgi:uncharacterized integral membrane protein (TIGR00698 family)
MPIQRRWTERRGAADRRTGGGSGIWAGLALAVVVGLAATALGAVLPAVGAPVLAIAFGVLIRHRLGARSSLNQGVRFASKTLLQAAVVLLGAGLSLGQIGAIGWSALPVMLGTLVLALAAGPLLGRWLGIGSQATTLITVGTGICGASAIATISAAIGASHTAIAVAVAVIFTYNVLAVLLFPLAGQLLEMPQEAFGVWAGTAINDTSSVVAAATVYGAVAASQAVVVKLTRTLMIVPIAVEHVWRQSRLADDGGAPGKPGWKQLVPPFLLLFLAAAALNSLGMIPDTVHAPLRSLAVFLTAVAMAAVGLGTPVAALREAGWRPLALGGLLWILVAASALGLQLVTGQL